LPNPLKSIFYYIVNYTYPSFEKSIIRILKNEKKLIIFDIGCYRGVFTKVILKLLTKKKYKFYLFDINKNVKKYIANLLKLKNIYYHEVAISNKNGKANYNYNLFFEYAGSSLSSLVKNDIKWVTSRKLISKILFLNNEGFIKYPVSTITIDKFLGKNKIKLVDVMKVDIDGSEYEFLQGAKKTIENNKVKIILLEIMGNKNSFNDKEKKIVNFFKKRNYTAIKKRKFWIVSLFSNLMAVECLFVSNKYLESQSFRNSHYNRVNS